MKTILQAFTEFDLELAPAVRKQYGDGDIVALREAWNDYTDMLTKERDGFNTLQYQHCPAWDDDMPDDDLEFILDAMGVNMTAQLISQRPDSLMSDMPKGSRHYACTITRGTETVISTFYSQGPAIKTSPDLLDVLQCLLSDGSAADESFDDWCANFGYDTDSRKAFATYELCKKTGEMLAQGFTKQELEDLNEMFSDR